MGPFSRTGDLLGRQCPGLGCGVAGIGFCVAWVTDFSGDSGHGFCEVGCRNWAYNCRELGSRFCGRCAAFPLPPFPSRFGISQ